MLCPMPPAWPRQMRPSALLRRLAFAVLAGLLAVPGAMALDDDYVRPTHTRMAKTLVRLGGVDLEVDAVLDEYARLVHCDLYQGLYANEFTWRDVRPAMRASLARSLEDFPVEYGIRGSVVLGRYDFDYGGFRLRDPEAIENVGILELIGGEPPRCGTENYRHFPDRYRVRLRRPITLRLVPMTPAEADSLRERLIEAGNTERTLWIRFNVSMIDILQANRREGVTFLANPDSVDLFADPAMTVPVYTYLRDDQRQLNIPKRAR